MNSGSRTAYHLTGQDGGVLQPVLRTHRRGSVLELLKPAILNTVP